MCGIDKVAGLTVLDEYMPRAGGEGGCVYIGVAVVNGVVSGGLEGR